VKKTLFAVLAVLLVLIPLQLRADWTIVIPVAYGFDLDTPTIVADDDRIVTVVNLAGTGTYTIAAQPDVPRNLTVTVVDTGPSITTGILTATGTDVNGDVATETFDLTGPTLTFTGAKIFASVTGFSSTGVATLGGAGDETLKVGVGAVIAPIFCSYTGPHRGPKQIVTSGSSTTVTGLASADAFDGVAVGDMLLIGEQTRYVAARANAHSITVGPTTINLSTSGVGFDYKTLSCGYGDTYGWVHTSDAVGGSVRVVMSADALTADSGGKVSVVTDCKYDKVGIVHGQTIADALAAARKPGVWTAGTNGGTENAYAFLQTEVCPDTRVGLMFNSGHADDASDTGVERINVDVVYSKQSQP
jgi:hypothetical protein